MLAMLTMLVADGCRNGPRDAACACSCMVYLEEDAVGALLEVWLMSKGLCAWHVVGMHEHAHVAVGASVKRSCYLHMHVRACS